VSDLLLLFHYMKRQCRDVLIDYDDQYGAVIFSNTDVRVSWRYCRGTGVKGLTRGLAASPRYQGAFSGQSIYPRIFLHIFVVYDLLLGIFIALLYSAICSCVLVALV